MAMIPELDPVPVLLRRLRAELGDSFHDDLPVRVSRAPGRLDVMGGIADYTGSLVCQATLDRAAAVALQQRGDRELQVFSFNLLDDHKPFTLRIPMDALARHSADLLQKEFAEPGRHWAGYLAGCLFLLHERGYVNLQDPNIHGLNLALYSTVPPGAGVSSSAAIEVATMMNLVDHFGLRERIDSMVVAEMCQSVENRIVGVPCGIEDQVTSCSGKAGTLLRLVCQPHQMQPVLEMPEGIRVLGINSGVQHQAGGGAYARTRCAAFIGHKIILEKMRDLGRAANRMLERDPMNGYLANLSPDDYKKFFRPYLPESLKGGEFLMRFGGTVDLVTTVSPDTHYAVRAAVDHHVLEAMRVRNFAQFLEQATLAPANSREQGKLVDKAGHLMYASHLSYTNDAHLGAPECDLLVAMVRERERFGLYGAKITGAGCGGTVVVLANAGEAADSAVSEILDSYHRQSGNTPDLFHPTFDGADNFRSSLFAIQNSVRYSSGT